MKKHVVFAVACLFIVIFNCGCLESGEGKVITMTIEEFVNDYKQSIDNDTKKITYSLKSLNDGDTLIIKDTLNDIVYNESYNDTMIDFETMIGYSFFIEGDITNTFNIGDMIELTLHIIKVTYLEQDPYTDEIWTIEQDTFKEGWNSEYNTFAPIPREYMRFLESDEGKVITMTMEEIINDYEYNVDNDTKKMSYLLKSLNHGDTLIIRDTVNDVTYNKSGDYTSIDFETSVGNPFPIEGDITDRFEKGDSIELTLHIIKDIFTQQNQYTGEIWTFEHETFKEGWDSENYTYIPFPQNVISHA